MVARCVFLVPLALAILLAGCGLIQPTPYPEYIAGLETVRDVGTELTQALAEQTRARYDLWVLDTPGGLRRLLLLVAPLPPEGAEAVPASLLVYDETGVLQGVVSESPDSLLLLARPILVAADGNYLVGSTRIDPLTLVTDPQPVLSHGLSGFGVASGGFTYLFSQPAGQTLSFTLEYPTYDSVWVPVPVSGSIDIIPVALRPVPDPDVPVDPNAVDPGYKLLGLRVLQDGTGVFLLSEPSTERVMVAEVSLAGVTSGAVTVLMPDGDPVLSLADMKDIFVYYSDESILIRDPDGWFSRFDWEGTPYGQMGAERGTGRVYALDPAGERLYRLDPVDRTLAVIGAWWQ